MAASVLRDGPSESLFRLAAKRIYDAVLALCGIVVLSPLFALIAALVKIADGGDIFYRQVRVGLGGREFVIYKFRTMTPAADMAGPSVTRDGDARVTWLGRFLRKTKFDELPQLWNVLKGEMSLVGPRPEVPRYVERYTPEQRSILRLKPGITDLASLSFRNEEALLANADNLEEFYIRFCIPRKLQLNQAYAARANLLSDTWIILQSVCPYWVGVLASYGVILAAAYGIACQLVTDFGLLGLSTFQFCRDLGMVVALQLASLTWQRQHRGLLSYFTLHEVRQLTSALGFATLALLAGSAVGLAGPRPNVVLVDALLSFCLLSGFRLRLRRWRESLSREEESPTHPPARVGIIGAGIAGAQLARELNGNPSLGRIAVAFFDDDFHKWQRSIHDVPVAGMPECLRDGWTEKLDEIVIAMPRAPRDRVRQIEQLLRETSLKYCTLSHPAALWARNFS